MPGPFSFKKLTDPVFEVEFPNNEVKKYDPWSVSAKLESIEYKRDAAGELIRDAVDKLPIHRSSEEVCDEIRKAFGFPTQAEVDASTDDPKPYTPTMNQAYEVQAALFEFIAGLGVTKKMKAMSAKS